MPPFLAISTENEYKLFLLYLQLIFLKRNKLMPLHNRRNHRHSMKSIRSFFLTLSLDKKFLLTLTPVLTVILNSQQAIIGLVILIIIDLITGAYKSLYRKGIAVNPLRIAFWRTINSSGMRESWKKAYEYGLGITILALIEAMVFPGMKFQMWEHDWSFAQFGIALAVIIEGYSIFENIEAVTGENPLKRISMILTNIRKIFKN